MPNGSASKEEAQQSRAGVKSSEEEGCENGVYFFNVIIVYRAMILVGMRHYVFKS